MGDLADGVIPLIGMFILFGIPKCIHYIFLVLYGSANASSILPNSIGNLVVAVIICNYIGLVPLVILQNLRTESKWMLSIPPHRRDDLCFGVPMATAAVTHLVLGILLYQWTKDYQHVPTSELSAYKSAWLISIGELVMGSKDALLAVLAALPLNQSEKAGTEDSTGIDYSCGNVAPGWRPENTISSEIESGNAFELRPSYVMNNVGAGFVPQAVHSRKEVEEERIEEEETEEQGASHMATTPPRYDEERGPPPYDPDEAKPEDPLLSSY